MYRQRRYAEQIIDSKGRKRGKQYLVILLCLVITTKKCEIEADEANLVPHQTLVTEPSPIGNMHLDIYSEYIDM